ncbi:MAG: cytochrome b/b6 domain-containing protein [Dehalococcoidia bacterium]|nr:cytochrome b/b6 domain-containing protein [Dehalococcoidia bacterium]
MVKKILVVMFALLIALGVGVGLSYTALKATSLFDNTVALWGLVAVAVVGSGLGVARGLMKEKNAIRGDLVTRHGAGSFVSHWGTALGIFGAIASGVILGFFIMNGKSIWFIPVFAKELSQVIPALNVHYFSVVLILFSSFFFVADYIATRDWRLLVPNVQDVLQGFIGKYFLRRKWEKEEKYLSSQKSAAVPYMLIGLVILLSGAVKVASHAFNFSASFAGWATIIHDVFTVFIILFTIVHVCIIVVLGDWPAFRSWFTGTMSTKFVEHHHPVWFDDLTTKTNKS